MLEFHGGFEVFLVKTQQRQVLGEILKEITNEQDLTKNRKRKRTRRKVKEEVGL